MTLTRRWAFLIAQCAFLMLLGGGMSVWALFGHPQNSDVVAGFGAAAVVAPGAILWRVILPALPLARHLDERRVPTPCRLTRDGRVKHLQPYCRCNGSS